MDQRKALFYGADTSDVVREANGMLRGIKFHGSCNWVPITRIRVGNATLMQHVLFNDTTRRACSSGRSVRVITNIVVYCESGTPRNALSGSYRRASLDPPHRTIPIPNPVSPLISSLISPPHLLTLSLASTTREEWSWSFPGWTVTNRVYSCQLGEACFTLCLPFVMLCKEKEFLPVAYSANRPLSYVRDVSAAVVTLPLGYGGTQLLLLTIRSESRNKERSESHLQ